MDFNFSEFKYEQFTKMLELLRDTDNSDICCGFIRTGELCFDILVRESSNGMVPVFDLYAGNVDTGYGYSTKTDCEGYPYDYVEGFNFVGEIQTYQKFIDDSIPQMEKFIQEQDKTYIEDLLERANNSLVVW